ncbi:MAG: VCBS repeat-containing protein, partial [Planctomycetota bacterium]
MGHSRFRLGRFVGVSIVIASWVVGSSSPAADCNGDGVDDAEQIASRELADCNRNRVPDVCDLSQDSIRLGPATYVFDAEADTGRPVLADFNGDGILDVTVGEFFGEFPVWIHRGDRVFEFRGRNPSFRNAGVTKAVDVNADGQLDIVSSTSRSPFVRVLYNGDRGLFAPPESFRVNSGSGRDLATGDFDGDGDQDLLTSRLGGVLFHPNNGLGVFDRHIRIDEGADVRRPFDLRVADFDGDEVLDAVVSTGD